MGGGKMSISVYPPVRTFDPPRGVTELSHIYHPEGLSNTLLSHGCVLETPPTVGMWGRMYILRTEKGVRSLKLLGSSSCVSLGSCSLEISQVNAKC